MTRRQSEPVIVSDKVAIYGGNHSNYPAGG